MHSELLKRVPLFEGLSDDELEALSDVALLRVFPKDRVVIMAEEEGDSLFVIHTGQVKVSIVSEDGREVILSILGEGNFFGEMALLRSSEANGHRLGAGGGQSIDYYQTNA